MTVAARTSLLALCCLAAALFATGVALAPTRSAHVTNELADLTHALLLNAEIEARDARIAADLAQLEAKFAAAAFAFDGGTMWCPSDRQRSRAEARLRELRREQAVLRRKLAIARQRAQRDRGHCPRIVISEACQRNPLGRDCM